MMNPRLQITELHKSFGKLKVLDRFDLDLDQPGITAILGPNGSGKTTLIKSILGMVLPDQGEIRVMGEDIKGKHFYREHIDYLPQIARFPENLHVHEVIEMVKNLRKKPAQDAEMISFFELEDQLEKKLGQLSGGTRQKINLVLACMFDSPIMILDEPTAGLDPVAVLKLKQLLNREKAKGKLILITTHIMSFVEEMSDRLVFLLNGKVLVNETLPDLKSTYGEKSVEQIIADLMQGIPPDTNDQPSINGHKKDIDQNSYTTSESLKK
jgi:Cu-processing system ATP-binding protein